MSQKHISKGLRTVNIMLRQHLHIYELNINEYITYIRETSQKNATSYCNIIHTNYGTYESHMNIIQCHFRKIRRRRNDVTK